MTEYADAVSDAVTVVHLRPGEDDLLPLSVGEQQLVHPRAVPSRIRDFRMGRTAARLALAQLGFAVDEVLRGQAREPLWPHGVVGSITHANGHAIAAVSVVERCGGLGVDLEHRDRWFVEIEDRVVFEEEAVWLDQLRGEVRKRAALEVFSAKESIYKAFFPRVKEFFGFEAARIVPGPTGGYLAWLTDELDAEFGPGRRFEVGCTWRDDLVLTSVVLPPSR